MLELWVTVPTYNEELALEAFVAEWIPALRAATPRFALCILNDGSTDSTLERARALALRFPEIQVVDKPNSGHGATCLEGYRLGIHSGAEWIFQIDSDGQCDPAYFQAIWEQRSRFRVIYGVRRIRDDGAMRSFISKCLSLVMLTLTRRQIPDPNVPYRLMRREDVAAAIVRIPADFRLVNVLLAAIQSKSPGIHWVPIRFRNRSGRPAATRVSFFAREALRLVIQYWNWPASPSAPEAVLPAPEGATEPSPKDSRDKAA